MVGDGGSGHLLELGVILVDHHLLGLDLGQPMPQLTLTHTRDGNVRHSGNCKTHTSRRKTFRLKNHKCKAWFTCPSSWFEEKTDGLRKILSLLLGFFFLR